MFVFIDILYLCSVKEFIESEVITMRTNKKFNIDKECIKTGVKIASQTLLGVGKVASVIIITTIRILNDIVTNKVKR